MLRQRNHTEDTESPTKEPGREADVRTFLRCVRSGDIIGRYADMEAARIWGGNRTTLAIVGTLLNHPEGMLQRDIAKAIFRTKQATTLALDNLAEKGFIRRCRDSKNRRINNITLTTTGTDHYYETLPLLTEMCHDAMSCLTEAELEQVYNILTKLASPLRERVVNVTAANQADVSDDTSG